MSGEQQRGKEREKESEADSGLSVESYMELNPCDIMILCDIMIISLSPNQKPDA